jgi:hypothetical protein
VFVDCGPLPAGSSRNDNTILPHYVLAWISQTRLAGPALRTPRLDELIPLFPLDQRKSQRGRSGPSCVRNDELRVGPARPAHPDRRGHDHCGNAF